MDRDQLISVDCPIGREQTRHAQQRAWRIIWDLALRALGIEANAMRQVFVDREPAPGKIAFRRCADDRAPPAPNEARHANLALAFGLFVLLLFDDRLLLGNTRRYSFWRGACQMGDRVDVAAAVEPLNQVDHVAGLAAYSAKK